MDTQPEPSKTGGFNRRRTALIGAVLGATLLAGTVAAIGSVAGAQDEPTVSDTPAPVDDDPVDDEQWAAFDQCMSDQLGDIWTEPVDLETADLPDPSEADFAAFDAAEQACESALPAEVQAEIAAWAPYEECIDAQIAANPALALDDAKFDTDFGADKTDAEWEALDAAWTAADDACADLLPEEAKAEMAAFEAFDQCLADAGITDDFDSGPMVHIDGLDQFQVVEFGDVPGSVTITGDANGISVTTDGGVSVLDEAALDAEWEAYDAAEASCEALLPADFFGDEFVDGGIFDGEFIDG